MKTIKILFVYLVATITFSALAGEAELMVSVNKDPNCSTLLTPAEIQVKVDSLNFVDPTMSNCFVNSTVVQYIDYMAPGFPNTSPYYGIAIVNFKWNCDTHFQAHLENLQDDGTYTLFSNPGIGPVNPAISGSN